MKTMVAVVLCSVLIGAVSADEKKEERSAQALLQLVWKPHGSSMSEQPERSRNLIALLVHPSNEKKARAFWMQAYREMHLTVPSMSPVWPPNEGLDFLLVRRFIAENLNPYILVAIRHQMLVCPGRSSMSYYWFREDGRLEGAGIISTGWRCELLAGEVTPLIDDGNWGPPFRGASELQLVSHRLAGILMTSRFVLGEAGLKLIQVNDIKGDKQERTEIGEPLPKPLQ